MKGSPGAGPWRGIAAAIVFSTGFVGSAVAWPPPAPGALCEQAIAVSQRALHLPIGILDAIARVESGRPVAYFGAVRPWPYAINAENSEHYYNSKQEAIGAVQALLARGVRSIDVGCVQVNLMYHANAFASLDEAFDPQANTMYGGRFLQRLYLQTGNWKQAVAAYHSKTPEYGSPYQQRVWAAWGGSPVVGVLEPVASPYGTWPPRGVTYGAIPPTDFAYRAFAPRH